MNIGFDLDGVLQDSSQLFQVMMKKNFGTTDFKSKDDAGNERFSYHIDGVSNQRIWNTIHDVLKNYQQYAKPCIHIMYPLMWVVENQKKPLQIISARPDDVWDETVAWLNRYIPVPYELYFVAPPKNGRGGTKNDLIISLGITHFVEDRFKNASEIAQLDAIQNVFLVNRPYNKGRRVANKVIRISHVDELIRYLK
jgi:uncharacterized HAD superfamily protein